MHLKCFQTFAIRNFEYTLSLPLQFTGKRKLINLKRKGKYLSGSFAKTYLQVDESLNIKWKSTCNSRSDYINTPPL